MKMVKWERKPLGAVADLCLGKMLDQNKNRGEPLPYLANVNVRWGEFALDDLRTMRFEPKEMDRYGLRFGDIVMCEGGEPGRCAIWKDQAPGMMIQKALHRIRPKEFLDCHFLFYSFLRIGQLKGFDQYVTGATIKHLPSEKLAKVEIEIPPLPIQQGIAGILSAYDELIENNQRRIRILEDMAHSLYREWFVHFRYPGYESVSLVDSPLGQIPQGWEVRVVEDVLKRVPSGKKYDQKSASPMGTVPILDQGKSGIIGYHDDEPGVYATEDSPIIVFANHTCYQRLILFPFSAIQNVLPFVPNPLLKRDIYWLHWATNGLIVFNDYKGHWPEFIAKELVVPPAEICQSFGSFTSPVMREILKLERAIEKLRRTRDLLLPRLLTGQIFLVKST
ncbi:MAG: restriction endonuclease subunit S [Comamonadaceae bacterium CG12_big_fil_rev_8_21_14_0_65_59_15]|nr:MAG: restriction endonuclease subunit S [Comamonadaceae bacterium CG12_big_fil_rev_8_21_14_0_65_59_15]